jgi:hypothetical protein
VTSRRTALAIAAVMIIAAAIAVIALGPADDTPPSVGFGFNDNAVTQGLATPDQTAAAIAAIGGTVDRVQVDWGSIEPREGTFDFSRYDGIYQADLLRGVHPLFIFAFAPPWASDLACAAAPSPCHAPPDTAHYNAAAAAAAELAKHYPKSAGIEIWNEPNSPHFWAPTPNPAAYSALVAHCYAAIKRVAPQMPVAAGSTSSSPGFEAGFIRAPDFVAGMKAAGAFASMDALSLHAYPDQADPSGDSAVASVEAVRDAIGEQSTPIWITETGATTTGPDAIDDTVQAVVLQRLSEKLAAIPGVAMVLVHTLIDPPLGDANPETGFGVLTSELARKPGYCALAQVWRADSHCSG